MKLKSNLNSSNFRQLLIFLILINFVLTACAVKPITTTPIIAISLDDNSSAEDMILLELRDNVSHYDRYLGKVVISFQRDNYLSEDGVEISSFKATLNKSNDTDIELKVLGIFNMVVAKIEYVSGEFKANSRGSNISDDILNLVTLQEIEDILKFMNTRYLLPDSSYTKYLSSVDTLFYGDRSVIIINSNNRVARYLLDGTLVEYIYELSGTPKEIIVSKKDRIIQIKFLNSDGWSLSE